MAYSGYLIKVLKKDNSGTDYTFPMHYILEKTYSMTYSVVDYNSTRNSIGSLVRNALPHKVPHCSFELKKMTNDKVAEMFSNLRSRYVIAKEKKVKLSVYVPEIDDYVEEFFYIPDIDLSINHILDNVIHYNTIKMEFIGY